jgi:lysozyme family protein
MMAISDRALYCISVVMTSEGGYSNDPNDPGGETNYGLSKRAYPSLDIKNLTADQAQFYYNRDYWQPLMCDKYPAPLDLYVFDSGFNQGLNVARKALQEACGVKVDGILGAYTMAAAMKVNPKRFLAHRIYHYMLDNDWDEYKDGWMIRLFNLCTR